jgi:hypothetical protein
MHTAFIEETLACDMPLVGCPTALQQLPLLADLVYNPAALEYGIPAQDMAFLIKKYYICDI